MNTEKKLYQWDTGQKLTGCTGLYVDFPIGNEVYRVETADGMCIIPDELLQTSGGHKVYECMTNNTIRSFAFSVTPRPKPPDYVYTPTERLTFEGLVQKVDDAVADMIRRAESGEFDGHTPVKGTDYFTTEEIQQIQNEVSSGAIGEFKSVVDTETDKFNANATEKVNTYNQNDSQKTTSYNANATEKLNAYNTNANNRVAEFDSHTEQIQTDISELKSDLGELENVISTKKFIDIEPTETVDGVVWYKYSETKASYYSNDKYGYRKYIVNSLPKEVFINTFTADLGLQYVFVDDDNNIISSFSSESYRFGGFVNVPSGATILYVNYSKTYTTTNFNPYGVKKIITYEVKLEKEETPTKAMVFDAEYDGYYTFASNTSNCVRFEDNTSYKSYSKRVCKDDIVRLKSGYFAALAGYVITDNSGLPYFVKHTSSSGSAAYDDIVTIERDGFLYVTQYGTSEFYEQGVAYVTKKDIPTNNDILNGKKIFFDGDSITMASGSGVIGYVNQISAITGCITQNLAVDGGTLTSGTTIVATGASRHHVCESILNSDADTDIYCISGGYNDFGIGQSDVGTYIEQLNSDLSVYDTTTLYGALDYIFTWLMVNRSGKPILFIMTHNPLNYRISGGSGKTANITLEQWFEAIKKMCKKYSVPYVNLFDETPLMTKLDSLKQFTVNNDGVHPTTEGYKRYYVPKIISALHSICPIDFE